MSYSINVRHLDLRGCADYKGPMSHRIHGTEDSVDSDVDKATLHTKDIAMNASVAQTGVSPCIEIKDLGDALDIKLTGNEQPLVKAGLDRAAEIYLPYDPKTFKVDLSKIQGTITELRQFGKKVIEATYSISTEGIKKLMGNVTESYYKLMDASRLSDTKQGIKKLTWDTSIAPVLTNIINQLGLKLPLVPKLMEDLRKYASVTLCGGNKGPCPESPEHVY